MSTTHNQQPIRRTVGRGWLLLKLFSRDGGRYAFQWLRLYLSTLVQLVRVRVALRRTARDAPEIRIQ